MDADFKTQRRAAAQPGMAWMHGDFREVVTVLPSGEWIVIWKNIRPELKEIHRSAPNLTAIGGLISLVRLEGD